MSGLSLNSDMIAHCSLEWLERVKARDYTTQGVREKDHNSALSSKKGNVSAFIPELGHHVVMVIDLHVKYVNMFIWSPNLRNLTNQYGHLGYKSKVCFQRENTHGIKSNTAHTFLNLCTEWIYKVMVKVWLWFLSWKLLWKPQVFLIWWKVNKA